MPQDKKNAFSDFGNISPSPTPSSRPSRNAFEDFGTNQEEKPNAFADFGGSEDTSLGGIIAKGAGKVISAIPGAQQTISTIAPALDFVSRPNYAVSRFIDSWADEAQGPLDAVAGAFTELFGSGKDRMKISMSDVIRRRFPDFAVKNPNATQVIGFVGDIATDPLSWLGVGTVKNGIQVGGKTLTKTATNAIKEFIPSASRRVFIGADGTLETIENLGKVTEKAKRVETVAEKFVEKVSKSVVVDDTGQLLPLYHGTDSPDFKSFNVKGDVTGVYFTTLPEVAEQYGSRVIKAYSTADNVLDLAKSSPSDLVDLATKLGISDIIVSNPAVETVNAIRNTLNPTDPLAGQKALVAELKKLGYKGMSFVSDDGGIPHQQFLIFNKKDIEMAYTSRGIRAEEKVTKRTGEIGKLDKSLQELRKIGYFDEVISRQDEIVKFLNQLSDNPSNKELAASLAKSEILEDLTGNIGKAKPRDIMYENEVTERLYERIGKLTQVRPETYKQIFEPKGVYLKVGLPFTQQKAVLKVLGLEGISSRIKALSTYINTSESFIPKALANTAKAFNRDFGLPTEYIKFRNDLENELGYLSDQMVRDTRKLFNKTDVEGREKIGNVMHSADDETRKLEQIRVQSSDPSFRTLTDGEAAQIFQESMDKFKLNPEERAIALGMQQSYKEVGMLEMRAGLLKSNLLNYSARGYEVINNVEDMSLITRGKFGSSIPQPYLASSKSRKFLTKAEAEAAGLVPELDAALLYAHRVLSSQRALAINRFKDSVTELFGAYTDKNKIAHTGILPTAVLDERLPKNIIDDMKMIGDSVYPSGMNDSLKYFLRGFDRLQGYWKRGATTLNPAFASKQLVSNTIQSALVIGTKAFKAFDPRVAIDAAITLMRGGKPLENLPPFLNNFISKYFTGNNGLDAVLAGRTIYSRYFDDALSDNFLNGFTKTTALGQKFTGTELVDLARQKGVIRGFDSTGEAFSQKVQEAILKDNNTYKNVAGSLAKVWNHAANVEDYSRMMLFLNGIGMGYTADDAVKVVNKALFDYQRGLSNIEKSLIKRVIPFYSFQRFAIPFVLKQTLQQPGNVATIEKVMRTMEKLLISGEELNPAEVDTFNQTGNNYILEQPRLLSGFDKTGTATLNLMNNLTPYDVLNLLTYNTDGEIDYARTAEKTFLAATTPFLKIPLTLLTKRDFFTGNVVSFDKSKDESSKISGNLDETIGKAIPQAMKELMSWEVRKNEVTGKVQTYINPWLSYYSMQLIPSLRSYIKPVAEIDANSNGYLWGSANAVMKLLSPTKSQNVDLRSMHEYQLLNRDKDIEEIESALIKSKIKGDAIGSDTSFEFEDNLKKLQLYLNILDENVKAREGFNIRGQGIAPVQESSQVGKPEPLVQAPAFK